MDSKLTFLPMAALVWVCQSCSTGSNVGLDTSRYPVTGVSINNFKKGQPTSEDRIFPNEAAEDFTRITGQWRPTGATNYTRTGTYYGAGKQRWWRVEIYGNASELTRKAITQAGDGYKAGLGSATNASARIYPRFERKKFGWGEAVSFFVQYQNDNTNYVPNNGMLTYEVHGLTSDGSYVNASFGVTHPGLVEFGPDVRDYKDVDPADPGSAMRRDPHYRLVESASPGSFEPSLDEIDGFLDTLEIGKH
jgi:hypothetical protein